jgi:hypothetical protein
MLFEILRFAQNDIFATCHSEGAKRLKNLGEQRFRNIIETCLMLSFEAYPKSCASLTCVYCDLRNENLDTKSRKSFTKKRNLSTFCVNVPKVYETQKCTAPKSRSPDYRHLPRSPKLTCLQSIEIYA